MRYASRALNLDSGERSVTNGKQNGKKSAALFYIVLRKSHIR